MIVFSKTLSRVVSRIFKKYFIIRFKILLKKTFSRITFIIWGGVFRLKKTNFVSKQRLVHTFQCTTRVSKKGKCLAKPFFKTKRALILKNKKFSCKAYLKSWAKFIQIFFKKVFQNFSKFCSRFFFSNLYSPIRSTV